MSKVSIIIIGYNSKKYLNSCIKPLLSQDCKNIEILFIDNNSSDGSYDFISKKFKEVQVVKNGKNYGYSYAANQGIKAKIKSDYIMIINPDVILEKDYISKILSKMEKNKKIGGASGKILKYDFENNKKTSFVDSLGLMCFKNRRIVDKGQGIEDKGQFEKEKEVFGVSGACPIYRIKALEDIKINNEYFDPDFFMYKEDIDVSWRMRLNNWKFLYIPSAVAYHGRGTGVLKRFTHLEVLKNRKYLSKNQKFYSLCNQRLMQIKNEFGASLLKSLPSILWKELLILGYTLFREPHLFKAYGRFLKLLPKMLQKRKIIMKNKKITSKEIEKWIYLQK